jgi:prostaglandin E receptor 4
LIFAGLTTIFFISFMSLERFLAVCFPYFYKRSVTKERVNIAILLLYLISITIAVLPVLGFGENVNHFPGSWCFFDFFGQSPLQNIYSYVYASIGLLLISFTAVFNVILIVTLAREIRRKELQDRNSSIHSASSRRRKRNDIYLMVFLTAILIVFGIFYSPLMVSISFGYNPKGNYSRSVLHAVCRHVHVNHWTHTRAHTGNNYCSITNHNIDISFTSFL